MSKNFFARLKAYYAKAGEALRGEAGAAAIFPNTTDIGISRERAYAAFLRNHVPRSCSVEFGGFLFDFSGAESAQIDVLVTSNSSLCYNLANSDGSGKTFACVDGTVAVASLKSTLDSRELRDALNNLSTIPEKSPLAGRLPNGLTVPTWDDWPFKIIYAPEGVRLDTLVETLEDYYQAHPTIPQNRRPNLIHVAGRYVIQRPVVVTPTRDGTMWPAHKFNSISLEDSDALGLVYAVTEIQKIASCLGMMFQRSGLLIDGMPLK